MSVDIIFRIAAIGVIIAVICQILKKSERDDIALLVSIVGLVVVLSMVVTIIAELFETVQTLFGIY